MGGRGASSGGASISRQITVYEKQMNSLGARMEKLAREGRPSSIHPRGNERKMEEYYKVQRQYNEIRRKHNTALNERARIQREKENRKTKENKTFVNSYGEATGRYITSPTYERAMKRQEKEILNFLGRR